MSEVLRTVVGNNAPPLAITLKHDGTVIDLTGASVILIIKRDDTGAVTNASNQSCTVGTPATAGVVSYSPASTDFTVAGRYLAQAKITYANSTVEKISDKIVIAATD